MALYKCTVIDASGKKQKITRDAESKAEIIDFLKQNKYIIVDIAKSEESLSLNGILKGVQKIKSKDLAVFCKQLYAMLKAGVTIVTSLEILKQQTENRRLSKIVGYMYEDLQKGNTLSEIGRAHV